MDTPTATNASITSSTHHCKQTLSRKSVNYISALVELPWLTVSAVIVKTSKSKRNKAKNLMLKCLVSKNHLSLAAVFMSEFQTAFASNASTTVHGKAAE